MENTFKQILCIGGPLDGQTIDNYPNVMVYYYEEGSIGRIITADRQEVYIQKKDIAIYKRRNYSVPGVFDGLELFVFDRVSNIP